MNQQELKQLVGQAALAYIQPNTIIGVGTGSTVNCFIEALPQLPFQVKQAVSSSEASSALLRKMGIEVLDANTVEYIKAHGGLKRENGDRLRDTLLSRGGSKNAKQLFLDFTGHEPKIEPLLKKRGLDAQPSN